MPSGDILVQRGSTFCTCLIMLQRTKEPGLSGILSQNFQARPETAGFLFATSSPQSALFRLAFAPRPRGFFYHHRLDRFQAHRRLPNQPGIDAEIVMAREIPKCGHFAPR